MRNERAWPQQCWKSCANGSNIVALRFGDHGTKEMLGVVGWKVWPVSNFAQQHATTCNRVCKRTQHVTSNNFGSFWPTMLRPVARGLRRRSCLWALKRMTSQSLRGLQNKTCRGKLSPWPSLFLYLFVCIQAELDQYCSALLEAGADLTPFDFIKKWK